MIEAKVSYAKVHIKKAFLELLGEVPFHKVRVTAIAEKAQLTRATFYFHYENIDDLVKELINEAISDAIKVTNKEFHNSLRKLAQAMEENDDPYILERCQDNLSPCYRFVDFDTYRNLFMDEEIYPRVIDIIFEKEKDKLVPSLMLENNLEESEAELIFRFILEGTMAINKKQQWEKSRKWFKEQTTLFRFILRGLNVLHWAELK